MHTHMYTLTLMHTHAHTHILVLNPSAMQTREGREDWELVVDLPKEIICSAMFLVRNLQSELCKNIYLFGGGTKTRPMYPDSQFSFIFLCHFSFKPDSHQM